ncbi:MAG: hypothetical protein ACLP0L_14275, partial [Solirubrobacteraceae bacterium]
AAPAWIPESSGTPTDLFGPLVSTTARIFTGEDFDPDDAEPELDADDPPLLLQAAMDTLTTAHAPSVASVLCIGDTLSPRVFLCIIDTLSPLVSVYTDSCL